MSYYNEFYELKQKIEKAFSESAEKLKEGETRMLFGEKEIVPTETVEELIDELLEVKEQSDNYSELPFCYFLDRYENNLDYKVVGFSRCDKYIHFHVHNYANENEYMHEKKYNFDIGLEALALLVDLI